MDAIFFENFDQIKPFAGSAIGTFNIDSLISYMNEAKDEVQIMVGKELMDELIEAYNDNSATEFQRNLIDKIRHPLVKMTFYKHSLEGSLYVSDNGYTTEETETTKRPYQWQMRDFRNSCLKGYSSGMANLWDFLIENIDDLGTYNETDEYLNFQQRPINQFKEWAKSGRRIADWRTHYALFPEMNLVWADLDKEISQDLIDQVNEHLVDGSDSDVDELLPYIQRYIAHATILRAIDTLPIEINANGIIITEIASTTANSDVSKQESDRASIKKQSEIESKKALCRLKKFLNENSTAIKYTGYHEMFLTGTTTTSPLNSSTDKLIGI